jgi:hypothetical protein
MAGGSNGYRAALVRRQHTLVLISSLPGKAGLPPFIFFSTSSSSPSIATLTMHANFMLITTRQATVGGCGGEARGVYFPAPGWIG